MSFGSVIQDMVTLCNFFIVCLFYKTDKAEIVSALAEELQFSGCKMTNIA